MHPILQIHSQATGEDHLRGRDGDVLRLRTDRIGEDTHHGRRVQRKGAGLQERHLRDGRQGCVCDVEHAALSLHEPGRLGQLLRDLQRQGGPALLFFIFDSNNQIYIYFY